MNFCISLLFISVSSLFLSSASAAEGAVDSIQEDLHNKSASKSIELPLKIMSGSNRIQISTEVYLGGSKKPFSVGLDIQSTEFWIPDSNSTSHFSQTFNCNQSDTCEQVVGEDNRIITYAQSKVVGKLVQDRLVFSDRKLSQVPYKFILAEQSEGIQAQQQLNGVLGVGKSANDEDKNKSLLQTLQDSKLISKRILSLYLSSDCCKSTLLFGSIHESIDINQLSYYNISQSQFSSRWGFEIQTITLSSAYNSSIQLTHQDIQNNGSSSSSYGILSTTVSRIFVPNNQLLEIISILSTEFKIECSLLKSSVICQNNNNNQYPTITFQLARQTSENSQQQSQSPSFDFTQVDYIDYCDQDSCTLIFSQQVTEQHNLWIIGMPFFKKYITIFDEETNRIGFTLNSQIYSIPNKDLLAQENFSHPLFLLLSTLFLLSAFVFSCNLKERIVHRMRVSAKISDEQAGGHGYNQQAGGVVNQLEMSNKSDQMGESLEDQNDISEDISQDEISDIDHYSNKQNNQTERGLGQNAPNIKPK